MTDPQRQALNERLAEWMGWGSPKSDIAKRMRKQWSLSVFAYDDWWVNPNGIIGRDRPPDYTFEIVAAMGLLEKLRHDESVSDIIVGLCGPFGGDQKLPSCAIYWNKHNSGIVDDIIKDAETLAEAVALAVGEWITKEKQ